MLLRRLAALLLGCALTSLAAASASAGCRRSLTLREIPGGEPVQAQLIECDESERPALLEGNAHLTLCAPETLAATGASFEDCATAVAAAREALRKAKVRAALRAGTDTELIQDRYGASTEEQGALRTSAELSGSVPAGGSTTEGAAQ
jgi:hypothetical protein